MGKRYKKIVFEDELGNQKEIVVSNSSLFEISTTLSGNELIIKSIHSEIEAFLQKLPPILPGEYAKTLSVYTDKYGNKAPVPCGWVVSGIPKENTIFGKDVSLVIYHIPQDKSNNINWEVPEEVEFLQKEFDQFIYCPVTFLDEDGTIDGKHFCEQFGRRNYSNQDISSSGKWCDELFREFYEAERFFHCNFPNGEYDEKLTEELLKQCGNITKKYGGFYFSRYNISKSSKGTPKSVKGAIPWTGLDQLHAKKILNTMKISHNVTSHLMYGAEYDSVSAWFLKTKSKAHKEMCVDSSKWGNYNQHLNSLFAPSLKLAKTGSNEKWCVNNVYDYAGNVCEITQEVHSNYKTYVVRGGSHTGNYSSGRLYPVVQRSFNGIGGSTPYFGFRASLLFE